MTTVKRKARAKINLTLRVIGERSDGYHLLDSLVVFADYGDDIICTTHPKLSLSIEGAYAQGVPSDETNLVYQVAKMMRDRHKLKSGAQISLHKSLPNSAGIGGGSSDAAMVHDALVELWGVPPIPQNDPGFLAIGADLPVAIGQPVPQHMRGIGDILTPIPHLPRFAMVIVNPGIAVPTGAVFERWRGRSSPSQFIPDADIDLHSFCSWMGNDANDLTQAASEIAPEIPAVLNSLSRAPNILWSGMSGSGATCIGICETLSQAKFAAQSIQVGHPEWWVVPAERA